jgi:hypothetical protein
MKTGKAILILGVIFALSGCGEDDPTDATPNFDGVWKGTTSEGNPLSITVVAGQATELTYGVGGVGAGDAWKQCSRSIGCNSSACAKVASPVTIPASGQFTLSMPTTLSLQLTITGTLKESTGSGTGTYTISGGSCTLSGSFTWTATR